MLALAIYMILAVLFYMIAGQQLRVRADSTDSVSPSVSVGEILSDMRLEQQFLTRQLTGEEAASNWEVSHPEQYQQLSLFDAAVPGHI